MNTKSFLAAREQQTIKINERKKHRLFLKAPTPFCIEFLNFLHVIKVAFENNLKKKDK